MKVEDGEACDDTYRYWVLRYKLSGVRTQASSGAMVQTSSRHQPNLCSNRSGYGPSQSEFVEMT